MMIQVLSTSKENCEEKSQMMSDSVPVDPADVEVHEEEEEEDEENEPNSNPSCGVVPEGAVTTSTTEALVLGVESDLESDSEMPPGDTTDLKVLISKSDTQDGAEKGSNQDPEEENSQASDNDNEPGQVQDDDEDEGGVKDTEEEEGEVSDVEADESIPKTRCRFFERGSCTWGTNCRFLHISDKGLYNMFDSPQKVHVQPPPPLPPRRFVPPYNRPPFHNVHVYLPPPPPPVPPQINYVRDTSWERGLQETKEMLRKAHERKENDFEYEEKKLHLDLPPHVYEKENLHIERRVTHGSRFHQKHTAPLKKKIPIVKHAKKRPITVTKSYENGSTWRDPWRRSKTPDAKRRLRSRSRSLSVSSISMTEKSSDYSCSRSTCSAHCRSSSVSSNESFSGSSPTRQHSTEEETYATKRHPAHKEEGSTADADHPKSPSPEWRDSQRRSLARKYILSSRRRRQVRSRSRSRSKHRSRRSKRRHSNISSERSPSYHRERSCSTCSQKSNSHERDLSSLLPHSPLVNTRSRSNSLESISSFTSKSSVSSANSERSDEVPKQGSQKPSKPGKAIPFNGNSYQPKNMQPRRVYKRADYHEIKVEKSEQEPSYKNRKPEVKVRKPESRVSFSIKGKKDNINFKPKDANEIDKLMNKGAMYGPKLDAILPSAPVPEKTKQNSKDVQWLLQCQRINKRSKFYRDEGKKATEPEAVKNKEGEPKQVENNASDGVLDKPVSEDPIPNPKKKVIKSENAQKRSKTAEKHLKKPHEEPQNECRRELLLKQLKVIEEAIARKKGRND